MPVSQPNTMRNGFVYNKYGQLQITLLNNIPGFIANCVLTRLTASGDSKFTPNMKVWATRNYFEKVILPKKGGTFNNANPEDLAIGIMHVLITQEPVAHWPSRDGNEIYYSYDTSMFDPTQIDIKKTGCKVYLWISILEIAEMGSGSGIGFVRWVTTSPRMVQ